MQKQTIVLVKKNLESYPRFEDIVKNYVSIINVSFMRLKVHMESFGILGGGQLAWFLGLAAQELDIPYECYISSSAESVWQKKLPCFKGSSKLDLESFCKKHPFILFESELFPKALLVDIQHSGPTFLPSLDSMAIVANKFAQKQLWQDKHLPTANFHEVKSPCWDPGETSWVLKLGFGGYDGKGNYFVHKEDDAQLRRAFIENALNQGRQIYAEEWVDYKKELALISTRNQKGQLVFLPLVETIQHQGVCSEVKMFDDTHGRLNAKAAQVIRKITQSIELIGTFAVEFFLTHDDELIINEMAPRVHNSGHFSLEEGIPSQFENHIRAIYNLPLLECRNTPYFSMFNLLGPEGYQGELSAPDVSAFKHTSLYWYQKDTSKPLRKMGHINICTHSKEEFEAETSKVKNLIRHWRAL